MGAHPGVGAHLPSVTTPSAVSFFSFLLIKAKLHIRWGCPFFHFELCPPKFNTVRKQERRTMYALRGGRYV